MKHPGTPLERLRYRFALLREDISWGLSSGVDRTRERFFRLRYLLTLRRESVAWSMGAMPHRVREWLYYRGLRRTPVLEPRTARGLRRGFAVAAAGVVLMGFVAGGALLIGSRGSDAANVASASPVAVSESRSEQLAAMAKLAAENRAARIAARRRARAQAQARRARAARARARAKAASARRRQRAPASPAAPAPQPQTVAAEPPAPSAPVPVQPQPVSQPAPAPAPPPAPAPRPAPQPQGGVTFDNEG